MSVSVKAQQGKYLTFQLGEEHYGIEILKVQEIMGLMPVTEDPNAPEFVRGVISLRGHNIPIIDLRLLFGLAAQDNTERTCVVVVCVLQHNNVIPIGLLVDEVSEVVNIKEEQIEAVSGEATINPEWVLGTGRVGQEVIVLLNVDTIVPDAKVLL